MRVSLSDAMDVLSKWNTESNPVLALLSAGGMSVSFSGYISGVSPLGIRMTHHGDSDQPIVEMLIATTGATTFEYQEIREAKPEIRDRLQNLVAVLVVKSNGAECCFYERIT
jgi:hypothetical protein